MKTILTQFARMFWVGFLVWPGLACADTSGSELRLNTFFPFDLNAGDTLVSADGFHIKGPETLEWAWKDGFLNCRTSEGSFQIRPLIPADAEPDPLTPEMLIRMKGLYSEVPYIQQQLAGIDNPTDADWEAAFQGWLGAIRELKESIQVSYSQTGRYQPDEFAAATAQELNNNELVVPGSAEVAPPDSGSSLDRDIWLAYKGVPLNEDGTPDKWHIPLRANMPQSGVLPGSISREEALVFHHDIYKAFESSSLPLLVDVSIGEIIVTHEGGQ